MVHKAETVYSQKCMKEKGCFGPTYKYDCLSVINETEQMVHQRPKKKNAVIL